MHKNTHLTSRASGADTSRPTPQPEHSVAPSIGAQASDRDVLGDLHSDVHANDRGAQRVHRLPRLGRYALGRAALLGLCCLWLGCAHPSADRGDDFAKQGNWGAALSSYEAALRDRPTDKDLQEKVAQAKVQLAAQYMNEAEDAIEARDWLAASDALLRTEELTPRAPRLLKLQGVLAGELDLRLKQGTSQLLQLGVEEVAKLAQDAHLAARVFPERASLASAPQAVQRLVQKRAKALESRGEYAQAEFLLASIEDALREQGEDLGPYGPWIDELHQRWGKVVRAKMEESARRERHATAWMDAKLLEQLVGKEGLGGDPNVWRSFSQEKKDVLASVKAGAGASEEDLQSVTDAVDALAGLRVLRAGQGQPQWAYVVSFEPMRCETSKRTEIAEHKYVAERILVPNPRKEELRVAVERLDGSVATEASLLQSESVQAQVAEDNYQAWLRTTQRRERRVDEARRELERARHQLKRVRDEKYEVGNALLQAKAASQKDEQKIRDLEQREAQLESRERQLRHDEPIYEQELRRRGHRLRDAQRELQTAESDRNRWFQLVDDRRRRVQDLQAHLEARQVEYAREPAELEKEVWAVHRYPVTHWRRRCERTIEVNVRVGQEPRKIRSMVSAVTEDRSHAAQLPFGIAEDPMAFPLNDVALSVNVRQQLASKVASASKSFVLMHWKEQLQLARAKSSDGERLEALLQMMFVAPEIVTQDDRAAAAALIGKRHQLPLDAAQGLLP